MSLRTMWTETNDAVLQIRTVSAADGVPATRDSARPWWRSGFCSTAIYDDGNSYASPDYLYLYRIARALKPQPDDVFYDLGAGAGRVLCVMARRRLKKCVGVELSEALCKAARRNAERLRGRKTPIEIICGDAAQADLSDGTIYFMYNPFGPDTMRRVLDRIETSLRTRPRRIAVAYHNAVLDSLLEERPWLERYRMFFTAHGARVSFWRSPRSGMI